MPFVPVRVRLSALPVLVALVALLVQDHRAEAAPVAAELDVPKAAKPQRVVKKTPCVIGRRKARLAKRPRRLPCGASGGEARGDFNGDGIGDLAIGTPNENHGRVSSAGIVHVFYGTSSNAYKIGPSFTQDSVAAPVAAANFGYSLASGDYDGDGFGDLAVGAPGTTRANASGTVTASEHGEVAIIFGSSAGLSTARTPQVIEPTLGGRQPKYERENFGAALVWGQFGGGPEADLAIGAPQKRGSGAVVTLFGGPSGLDVAGFRLFTMASIFGLNTDGSFMRFGDSLTGGDFDGDGITDLVAGAPSLSLAPPPGSPGAEVAGASIQNAGAVVVLPGTKDGPSAENAMFLRQGREGLDETPESFELFGEAITAGDVTGDKAADLVVGVPSESTPGRPTERAHGAVHVIPGSPGGGIEPANDRLIRGEAFSSFGAAVVTGDLQGDGVRDLVVGEPDIAVGTLSQAGGVQVFYGTGGGLGTTAQRWNLNTSGVAGAASASGRYGSALTAWNFGGSSQADLVVGSPGASVSTFAGAGGFGTLYGSPTGLVATGSSFITQDTPDVPDAAEAHDNFGSSAY